MMVSPACLLPRNIYRDNLGKMVICNLQKTKFDNQASLLVRGYCDDVWYHVMKALGLDIFSPVDNMASSSSPQSKLTISFLFLSSG